MEKIINRNIELNDIINVDLLCSEESNEKIFSLLKRNINIHNGKAKKLNDAYFTICCLICAYNEKISLDALRIKTNEGEIYTILPYDIIENQIVINDNAVNLMLNVLKYLREQEKLSIKMFNYKTLDYIDEQKEEVTKRK